MGWFMQCVIYWDFLSISLMHQDENTTECKLVSVISLRAKIIKSFHFYTTENRLDKLNKE